MRRRGGRGDTWGAGVEKAQDFDPNSSIPTPVLSETVFPREHLFFESRFGSWDQNRNTILESYQVTLYSCIQHTEQVPSIQNKFRVEKEDIVDQSHDRLAVAGYVASLDGHNF